MFDVITNRKRGDVESVSVDTQHPPTYTIRNGKCYKIWSLSIFCTILTLNPTLFPCLQTDNIQIWFRSHFSWNKVHYLRLEKNEDIWQTHTFYEFLTSLNSVRLGINASLPNISSNHLLSTWKQNLLQTLITLFSVYVVRRANTCMIVKIKIPFWKRNMLFGDQSNRNPNNWHSIHPNLAFTKI